MIKKQFYDIKFKVGISTEGESIITNITIPKLTLTRNMFNIEGNIIISDPGMNIISMKNAINYCLYLIVKTLEWIILYYYYINTHLIRNIFKVLLINHL